MMWRTLRAFAWMRWRVLMNSLERTGGRDTLERFSVAIEQLAPVIAFIMLVPSSAGLAALAGYAGYWLPAAGPVATFDAVRALLLIACGFSLLGPLLMPAMERTSAVRLLLLPIPRRTLYVAQAGTALSDPWIVLTIPVLLALPIGLLIAGAPSAAVIAFVAGLLLLLVLVGLSAVATFLLHLIVRDRRRGELVALLLVVLPVVALMPGLLTEPGTREERRAERAASAERRARGEETATERLWSTGRRASALLPSELFSSAARASALHDSRGAALPVAALAATGILVHGLGLLTFARLLDSPSSGARRQVRSGGGGPPARIPGLSRASAAVARAQVRLAMRTPRGQSILLSPLLVFAMLALLMSRRGGEIDLGWTTIGGGLGLATFGAALCMLSILPFAMNQFAIDRAGLTLAMLSPIATRELLLGKAVGNAMIVGAPTVVCALLAYLLFRDGALWLWVSLALGLVATYALASPGAAALSAIFPRAVDLNSIGRGSNAHGVAGLLGLVLFVGASLPAILLAALSIALLRRPHLAPLLLGAWCIATLLLNPLLLTLASRIVDRRRETLLLIG
jgi:ABC-type transport system involved in cytochrome c biogenesis permease component